MTNWLRPLISGFVLFGTSLGFTQTICTKVFNPELHLRTLSVQLNIDSSRELMTYAMAGATQSAMEGVRKRLHRSPQQRFYTPNEKYELLAFAHMNSPTNIREANYAKIKSSADHPDRPAVFGAAPRIHDLARDLRDSIEHQQTVSETIADLYFYRLFAYILSPGTRIELTYLLGDQILSRDVTMIGPMISSDNSIQTPKFEFLPLVGGRSAKELIVVEPSMVLNVQLMRKPNQIRR